MKKTVYLGLGSNLGDRVKNLATARDLLTHEGSIEVMKISQLYETEPWPKHTVDNGRTIEIERQNWHLNQVICLKTRLSAQELLLITQYLEKKMGKTPKTTWGSREIDIDILLYGDDVIDSTSLKVPHPFMTDREFVLVPLLEISPESKDPRSGKFFREFLDAIQANHTVHIYSENNTHKNESG